MCKKEKFTLYWKIFRENNIHFLEDDFTEIGEKSQWLNARYFHIIVKKHSMCMQNQLDINSILTYHVCQDVLGAI